MLSHVSGPNSLIIVIHSMQMKSGQVNYHTILTLETCLYIIYIHHERRTVPLKVLPLTSEKTSELVAERADPSGFSFGNKRKGNCRRLRGVEDCCLQFSEKISSY